MRLLQRIRERTEHSHEPVFVTQLAPDCQLSVPEVEAAWRYLRDQGLIDTFSILYTARINARGIDALDSSPISRPGDSAPIAQPAAEPVSGKEESTADRWIRVLKNNRAIAAVVVLAVIIIGVGAVAEAIKHIRESFAPAIERQGKSAAVAAAPATNPASTVSAPVPAVPPPNPLPIIWTANNGREAAVQMQAIDHYVNESCHPDQLEDLRSTPNDTNAEDANRNLHYLLECLKVGQHRPTSFKIGVSSKTEYDALPGPKMDLMAYIGLHSDRAIFFIAPK